MIDLDCDILEQDAAWPALPDIKSIVIKTLVAAGYDHPAPSEVSIVLSTNAEVQILNRDYRGQDKPTNVLSFPQDEPGLLGDIIFALETVQRECAQQNKDFADHFTHLLVHGTLHLLGYDHIEDEEAEEMEALEVRILDDLGVKNPYTPV